MNKYKVSIPDSYRRYGDITGNYDSNYVDKGNENFIECYNGLKLLSINEARKIFSIRHETLTKLIEEKKIGYIVIEEKIKIPFWCLKEFQKEQIKISANQNNGKAKDHFNLNSIQEEIDYIINQNKNCIYN